MILSTLKFYHCKFSSSVEIILIIKYSTQLKIKLSLLV